MNNAKENEFLAAAPDMNVSILSTCRDEIIQDFSSEFMIPVGTGLCARPSLATTLRRSEFLGIPIPNFFSPLVRDIIYQ